MFSDGGWSGWITLKSCSLTCGGGLLSRTRYCESPAPMNGGKDCVGHFQESVECNPQPCPTTHGTTHFMFLQIVDRSRSKGRGFEPHYRYTIWKWTD